MTHAIANTRGRFYKITPRQESFLLKLLDGKVLPATYTDDVVENITERMAARPCELGKSEASAHIDVLVKQPWKSRDRKPAQRREAAGEGYYFKDGEYVQVKFNRAGTNRYGLVLRQSDAEGGRWKWEYQQGIQFKVDEDDRLTPEQAAEFGRLYGQCCVCARLLTDPVSVERGIGPICEGRLGLSR